jgi:pyrroline-5-carboxylate reductase
MGIAILSGILTSLKELDESTSPKENLPSQLPRHFIACVKSEPSVKRVEKALSQCYSKTKVEVSRDDNLSAVQKADIIILGCKPYMVKDILQQEGMREALAGKLLLSICAGLTKDDIATILDINTWENPCTIVRTMPSTASLVRQSMTVIGISDPPLPHQTKDLITWIFKQIGDVVYLPPHLMDVSTALCGSGPAFFALVLEAATDGAVAMGVPRADAQRMAAQTMRGTADLVLNGEHPAVLKDKVSTPGGCTIGGLMVLEEGAVRGTVARAIREATVVASQLGQGAKNVNGTRH